MGVGFEGDWWAIENTYCSPVAKHVGDNRVYLGPTELRLWDICRALEERNIDAGESVRSYTHGKRDFVVNMKLALKAACTQFVNVDYMNLDTLKDYGAIFYTPNSLLYACELPTNYFDKTPWRAWETDATYSYYNIRNVLSKLICIARNGLDGLPGNAAVSLESPRRSARWSKYTEINSTEYDDNSKERECSTNVVETSWGDVDDPSGNYALSSSGAGYGAPRWISSFSGNYGITEISKKDVCADIDYTGKTESYSLESYIKTISIPFIIFEHITLGIGSTVQHVFGNKNGGSAMVRVLHKYSYPRGLAETNTWRTSYGSPVCTPSSTTLTNPPYTSVNTCYGYDGFPHTEHVINRYDTISPLYGFKDNTYMPVVEWYNSPITPTEAGQAFYLEHYAPYDLGSMYGYSYSKVGTGKYGNHGSWAGKVSGTSCGGGVVGHSDRSDDHGDYLPTDSICFQIDDILIMLRMDIEGGYAYY